MMRREILISIDNQSLTDYAVIFSV